MDFARAIRTAAAALLPLLAVLQAGCMTFPEGEVEVTYGPLPPDVVNAGDATAICPALRVTRTLAGGITSPFWGSHTWDLWVELETAQAKAGESLDYDYGYVVIEGRKLDAPLALDVDWTIRRTRVDILASIDYGDRGFGFEMGIGLGLGRADLDVRYEADNGTVIRENLAMTGVNLLLDLGYHPAGGVEVVLRMDFLIASRPVTVFEGVMVFRPWPVLGFFGGWRTWLYSDDEGSDSELELTTSGPLLGVELRF